MTNRVYFLTIKSPSPSHVVHTILIRFYGKSNIIIQREKELEIAKLLSSKGLAPKWYLSFGNGRIEEYLDCQSVTAPIFRSPLIASQIAMNLGRIHQLLPDLISHGIFPSHENQIWRIFDERRQLASDAFQILLLHSQQLSRDTPHEECSRLTMLLNIQSWNPFHSEKIEILKMNILKVNSPLVYAHCDLHHGNVILIKTTHGDADATGVTPQCGATSMTDQKRTTDVASELLIIDFEYGISTSRGYDLANFFCEFCGDYDSSEQIPAHVMDFSRYPEEESRKLIFQSYCEATGCQGDEKVLESLETETRVYLPLVHLQWAHWGLIKAADEIQRGEFSSFDYLSYAHQRYFQWNQEIRKQQT